MSAQSTRDGRNKRKQYQPEFAPLAKRLLLLGLSDVELRLALNAPQRTLDLWAEQHPEFAQALEEGRTDADAKVAAALFKRATGFTKRGLRKPMATKLGIAMVEYDEYFPPDVGACQTWLRARQPERWKALAPEKPTPPKDPAAQPGAFTIHIDADTLALTGLPPPAPEMKDVTPAQ